MQMREGYTDGHKGAWIMAPDVFTTAFQIFWDRLPQRTALLHCFRDRVAEALKLAAQVKFEQLKHDGREVIPNDLPSLRS
jgi:hypothetical protein